MHALDLLFPSRCLGCDRRGAVLCPDCLPRVGVVVPPLCRRCGRPWPLETSTCRDCPPSPVAAARAPFLYDGPVGRAVRQMKYAGWRALAPRLAGAMAACLEDRLREGLEAACWVPVSARRRRRRGFDQAELLARRVAARLDLPAARLLARRGGDRQQAGRPGADRRRALRGAFSLRGRVPGEVLLVDDVLTTGATAAACAEALRESGARRVVLVTAARAVGGPVPAGSFGLSAKPAGGLY